MALAIIMKEGAKDGFSAEAQSFPSLLPAQTLSFMGISISLQHIAIIVVACVAIGGLQWFVTRTRTGRQMQAAAQNPGVALILGIPVARMVMLTFLINAGLAALASVLISPIYLAKFSNGEVIGLFAFIAAIVGGFNQVRGALAGGLIVGVIDSLAAAYVSTSYRLAVPLVLLVIIILVNPKACSAARRSAGYEQHSVLYGPCALARPPFWNKADGVLITLLVAALLLWFVPAGMGRYGTYVLSLWLVTAIAVMGLNLTLGLAGLKSLAQAAFMGIGAYATALLTTKGGMGWLPPSRSPAC